MGGLEFKYRIGWYAPLVGSYFSYYPDPAAPGGIGSRTTVAGRHCDGSLNVPHRIRSWSAWTPGRPVAPSTGTQTVFWTGMSIGIFNFNGATAELPQAFNDWANIRLNQVGAGRNVGGPFIDAKGYRAFGPLYG